MTSVLGELPPDHAYEVPPVAVSVTDPHAVLVPVMPGVGSALTVTDVVEVAEQPAVFVTLTVYVPLVVGLAAV